MQLCCPLVAGGWMCFYSYVQHLGQRLLFLKCFINKVGLAPEQSSFNTVSLKHKEDLSPQTTAPTQPRAAHS